MRVDYTDAQRALRSELREYFAKLMPPEIRAQIGLRYPWDEDQGVARQGASHQ